MERKIWIADDEEDVRCLQKDLLEYGFPDYNTELFASGTDIQTHLEKILSGKIDSPNLLICDNTMMPGLTGLEIIREYASKMHFPIILHSACDESVMLDALACGAHSYLPKPTNMDKYFSAVRNALEKSSVDLSS